MPQGDFTNFSSTTAAVAVSFLGGYLVWVGWWAPRVVALFKARNWLVRATFLTKGNVTPTSRGRVPLSLYPLGPGLALAGTMESSVWPESFLVVVQFGLLVALVTRLSLPSFEATVLVASGGAGTPYLGGPAFLAANLAGFLGAWSRRRAYLFVGGPFRVVTGVTEVVLLTLQVTPLRGENNKTKG